MEDLYQVHKASLARFARGLTRSERDAEDLVQDTFERAMAHIVQLSTMFETNQRAWLYTVAKNLWRDRQRRQQLESRWLESEKHQMSGSVDTTFRMTHIAARLECQDLLNRLPANLRDIIILRYWQGLSSREMAKRLKIPDATVRARLRAAIKRLRATFPLQMNHDHLD
ncbi:RNA polymerase sigma factor [Ferroacidibacillus organovorans]|uniref:RNA polymerase subunit sigma n=1 Tax=Ferroacidibacillus organovorans TaxID=1765683 RepID=A0A1V4ERU1_9BACL|nr:RNA polymerase sigma factor [Ferroacidibacillus organovorans]OPG15474.1 hypothetical protein B2M26_10315 [Ferroacidibacillus organovorans]